jgi:hypothetical protein
MSDDLLSMRLKSSSRVLDIAPLKPPWPYHCQLSKGGGMAEMDRGTSSSKAANSPLCTRHVFGGIKSRMRVE